MISSTFLNAAHPLCFVLETSSTISVEICAPRYTALSRYSTRVPPIWLTWPGFRLFDSTWVFRPFTHKPTFSVSIAIFSNILFNSFSELAKRITSSAYSRDRSLSPPIRIPSFSSQSIPSNAILSVAVKSLGLTLSPCFTPRPISTPTLSPFTSTNTSPSVYTSVYQYIV